jgi:hypothetical protein
MNGRVVGINCNKGFIAIDTGSGISVVELLGGYDVEMGDKISGDLEALGGESLYNISQQEEMDTYIQGVGCSRESANRLMR